MFQRSLRGRSARPAVVSPRRSSSSLALESLEDRTTFDAAGVQVYLDADQNLVVSGDDSRNSVVIEERGLGNVEKYVTLDGKLLNDGKAFVASGGKVLVDLKGGDDSLVIRGQKSVGYDGATIGYSVDLGAGNDSFEYSAGVVSKSTLEFTRLNAGDGRDKVRITLGDVSGSTVGFATGASAQLGNGDDLVKLQWTNSTNSTLSFAGDLPVFGPNGIGGLGAGAPVGFDLGLGSDRFEVRKGNVSGGQVAVSADLGDYFASSDPEIGVEGRNVAHFHGDATQSNGALAGYAIFGGSNVDRVTYDDDSLVSHSLEAPRVYTAFDLNAGDDVLNVIADGNRTRPTLGGASVQTPSLGSQWALQVELAAGDDRFTQSISARTWSLVGNAAFGAEVSGGMGNDLLALQTSRGVLDVAGVFDAILAGGSGDDRLNVALGDVRRHGLGYLNVEAHGFGLGPTNFLGPLVSKESDDDSIFVQAAFTADSTPDPQREGNGPGSIDYVPSAAFVLTGEEGADSVGLSLRNRSAALTVHKLVEPGDDLGDRRAERVAGKVLDGVPAPG